MDSYEKARAMLEQFQQNGGDMNMILCAHRDLTGTGKTPLGLNQWVLTDKPRMEEFNEDNRIVDERLRALEGELAEKADSSQFNKRLQTLEADVAKKTNKDNGAVTRSGLDAIRETQINYCYINDITEINEDEGVNKGVWLVSTNVSFYGANAIIEQTAVLAYKGASRYVRGTRLERVYYPAGGWSDFQKTTL